MSISMLMSPVRPSFHVSPTICGAPFWRPIAYTSGKIAFSAAMMFNAIIFAWRSTLPIIAAIREAILPSAT